MSNTGRVDSGGMGILAAVLVRSAGLVLVFYETRVVVVGSFYGSLGASATATVGECPQSFSPTHLSSS